ncbi:MAG: hypothetical protein NVSMB62_07420 [Acidobacteriaceae bacterium]
MAEDLAELKKRIASLTAADVSLWGSMTVGEMVCHVRDSYEIPVGVRRAKALEPPKVPLALMKWIAFRSPMKWPQGIKTVPEVDQRVGGTPPVEFGADVAGVLAALNQFAASRGPFEAHPIFGPLTTAEWMRWGYLHADHHLRQFGR